MDMDEMLAEAMQDVLEHVETCTICDDSMNLDDCTELNEILAEAFKSARLMHALTFDE